MMCERATERSKHEALTSSHVLCTCRAMTEANTTKVMHMERGIYGGFAAVGVQEAWIAGSVVLPNLLCTCISSGLVHLSRQQSTNAAAPHSCQHFCAHKHLIIRVLALPLHRLVPG